MDELIMYSTSIFRTPFRFENEWKTSHQSQTSLIQRERPVFEK